MAFDCLATTDTCVSLCVQLGHRDWRNMYKSVFLFHLIKALSLNLLCALCSLYTTTFLSFCAREVDKFTPWLEVPKLCVAIEKRERMQWSVLFVMWLCFCMTWLLDQAFKNYQTDTVPRPKQVICLPNFMTRIRGSSRDCGGLGI
jgi:hypothetical protein